jgi:hypothetical protein
LDLRWAFWGDWQLFLRAGLGVDPEQRQFTRRSDGSLLYRTPILRATASLGLVVPLSR